MSNKEIKAVEYNVTDSNGKKIPLLALLRGIGYSDIHCSAKPYAEARFFKRLGYSDLQIIAAVLECFPLQSEKL
jgi:hypothetical protein